MKKINVLIADDEKIVREGLRNYVDWQEYNMTVIGTAENGKIALDIIQDNKVDLLVTDIYMPVLDGMELVSRLSEMEEKPLVVLISGLSDFKYAQTAIRTAIVQDYILKPLDFDRMDEVFTKIRDKILHDSSNVSFPILDKDEWELFSNAGINYVINNQNEILAKIGAGEIEEAISMFEHAFHKIIADGMSRNFIARYCIEVALNTAEFVLGKVESKKLLEIDPVAHISKLKAFNDISEYVINILKTAHLALSRTEDNNISPLIHSVLKYINNNYKDSSITLNMIADNYNASPSYMSTKFKEQTGITFIKYLNGLRVKKAKELLKDISLKVYEISSKVGYEDVRYFSRIFRIYTGYTPTEYQKKVVQYIDKTENYK